MEEEDIHVTSGCGVITISQASEKGGKQSVRDRVTTNGCSGYFGGPQSILHEPRDEDMVIIGMLN